jgi:hypothetical protein
VRKTSKASLESAGYTELAALLTPSLIPAEDAALKKLKEAIDVAQLQVHADTPEEAIYETLWHAYEKQREKEGAQPTKTLYASMVASLTKLQDQALKCGQSSTHCCRSRTSWPAVWRLKRPESQMRRRLITQPFRTQSTRASNCSRPSIN